MKPEIVARLLKLNHQFYQTFALQFSSTRQRLQPGVRRIVEAIPGEANLLDLGCGNGELARELARRGHRGLYTGLDFSSSLLAEAQKDLPAQLRAAFFQADLASPDWDNLLPVVTYQAILAFAVLHHLPGDELRRSVLQRAARHLPRQGLFYHSVWQFLNSPRLRERIQPWETIGLSEEDVAEGDYLLDWRQGGFGLRYVHHFSTGELNYLAGQTGFTVKEAFLSDGANGKLGLYQVWEYN